MQPFTLHVFQNGREFQMHGVIPAHYQRDLLHLDRETWRAFLSGLVENVNRLDLKHPRRG